MIACIECWPIGEYMGKRKSMGERYKTEENNKERERKYERMIKINIQQSHHRMVDRCG